MPEQRGKRGVRHGADSRAYAREPHDIDGAGWLLEAGDFSRPHCLPSSRNNIDRDITAAFAGCPPDFSLESLRPEL